MRSAPSSIKGCQDGFAGNQYQDDCANSAGEIPTQRRRQMKDRKVLEVLERARAGDVRE